MRIRNVNAFRLLLAMISLVLVQMWKRFFLVDFFTFDQNEEGK
jgi:hypothetical protein